MEKKNKNSQPWCAMLFLFINMRVKILDKTQMLKEYPIT